MRCSPFSRLRAPPSRPDTNTCVPHAFGQGAVEEVAVVRAAVPEEVAEEALPARAGGVGGRVAVRSLQLVEGGRGVEAGVSHLRRVVFLGPAWPG